jgi:hypothetical protein
MEIVKRKSTSWILKISKLLLITIALISFLKMNEAGSSAQIIHNDNGKQISIMPVLGKKNSSLVWSNQVSMFVGDKNKFTTYAENINPDGGKWSIGDSSVASVNKHGVVKAKKEGSTELLFETKNKKYSCTFGINVFRKVKSLKLNETSFSINVGETHKVSYKVVPSDAKIILVPAFITNDGQIVGSNQGPIRVEQDGTIVGINSGVAVVGFRYGIDPVKDIDTYYSFLSGDRYGFVGSIKVKVFMNVNELKEYIVYAKKFHDQILTAISKKEIDASGAMNTRDLLETIYNEKLSSPIMENADFKNMKRQLDKASIEIQTYYNGIISKGYSKKKNAAFKKHLEILMDSISKMEKTTQK